MAGKPLIALPIEPALVGIMIDRVIVSTDDEKIANVGRRYADVPLMSLRNCRLLSLSAGNCPL